MKRKTIFGVIAIIISTLCFAFTAYSQPTYAQLGIPDDLKVLENVVIQSNQTNTPALTKVDGKTALKFNRTAPGFTAYGLNYLHDKIHEEDYEYMGLISGKYTFFKPSVLFSRGYVPASYMTIYKELDKWVIKLKTLTMEYRFVVGGKWVIYTAQELATLGNISTDALWESDADYYYGVYRDPSKYITSWFMTMDSPSENVFTSQLWVNFKLSTTVPYGKLITSYNQTGASYQMRWYVYNDCSGNFGECVTAGPYKPTDLKAWAYTANIDYSRKYAIVECKAVELPDQGKNAQVEGYYTVKGCDEDDPCGYSQRLPRTPVQ